MTIGRFAHASGLTIKALRFYDENGLLEPRSVDPETGYRRYSGGQLRRAAMIKVLRQMGMSLAQVREVVDNPDRAAEHLTRFIDDLNILRARQDSAVERGMEILSSYDQPVQVQTRVAPAQHWVGAAMSVDPTRVDPVKGAQDFEATFMRLGEALQESDNPPVASFWTT
ncbi:MerR family transcriptional regulator, partial [Asanoa siamensis]|uniref:MerR family transcriptional regulator n=1 Tax=Asanoa siamensis TaxID=926357 RepID=UPI001940FED9